MHARTFMAVGMCILGMKFTMNPKNSQQAVEYIKFNLYISTFKSCSRL